MKYKLFPWLIGFLLLVVIFLASFSAPTVTRLDPAEKQIKATYNAPFTIHFSHIMHQKSVEDNFLILPKTDGSFRWKDLWTLEFIPDEPLTIGDEYRIIIKGEAKSIWYKKLGYDVTIHYLVTGPPFVLFTDPAAGEVINKDGAITVMFDRPMDFDGRSKSDLIRIEPPVSGEIKYFGLSAFQFYPEKLKATQTYEVTIPAGLSAIDGGETTEGYSWIIATPDLKVEKSEPVSGSKDVVPDWPIQIYFDAEVPLEAIKPGVNALLYPSNDLDADVTRKMDGFFNTEVTYAVDEQGEPLKDILVFKPTFDYQPGEDYKFVLKSDKDLHLAEDFELDFRTLGEAAEEAPAEAPEDEVTQETDEEKKPAPVIWEDHSMQFFIRGENPRLRLDEPLSGPAVLSVCQVSSNEFIRVTARNGWDSYRCQDTEPETIDPAQKDDMQVINLNDYFKLSWNTGVYYASVRQGDERIIRHFLIEDTTLLMKRSASDLLVWALDVKSGKPVPAMDIEVLSYDGETVAQGKTDETGVYSLNRMLDEGIYVRARLEDSEGISRWGLVADRWTLGDSAAAADETSGLFVLLDQRIFSPGDSIKVKGIWRELKDDVLDLPTATQVTVTLEDSRGDFVISKRIPMRRNGSFDCTLAIPGDLPSGDYRISVTDLNLQRLSEPVPIHVKDGSSDLRLEWIEAQKDYVSETTPVLIAKARYKNGISAGQVKGEYQLYRHPSSQEYQKGAVSYNFESIDHACTEACQEWKPVLNTTFEFDLNGKAKILLTGQDDKFLASGYDYHLQITASLPDGEPVRLNHAFTVHQGSYDLALGVKHALIDVNETIDASIFTMSREDKGELIGGKRVKLALISQDGKEKKVFEDTYETGPVPLTVSIPVTPTMQDGVYLLQARSQDDKRNEIVAEQLVYVSTNPLQTVGDGLLLAADQQKYFVGGRAHFLINEPEAAEDNPIPVILTYERNGLLGYEAMELTAPVSRVTVPIKSSMMPAFKAVLTRFNRGVSPSFSSVSQMIKVGNDESEIMVDLSYEPLQPKPGSEVTFRFRTYDFQNRPLSSVITLNLLNLEGISPRLSYGTFFPNEVRSARSASNISFQKKTFSPPDYGESDSFYSLSPAESVYFDPLITTNAGGEASITLTLPDERQDLFAQVVATKDSGQFGVAGTALRMNKALEIEPVLPSSAVPGDQTILAAVVKNISDHPVQDRLELFSSDLLPKGDVTRNFSLQPGQQTEISFSIFMDTILEKEAVHVEFRAGSDKAEGVIPLKHYRGYQRITNSGLQDDIWTRRIQLPKDAYPGLGTLDLSLGGGPLILAKGYADALESYPYQSTYLAAVRLLLETNEDSLQTMVSDLLTRADKDGGYRFWNESSASPSLTALVLLAYSKAAEQGIHIDSIQLNRTIDYLWKSLDQNSLDINDKIFIMWTLGESGQFDTERALGYYQNRETMSIRGKVFLLMTLDQLVRAGQGSMAAAFDSLKSELLDEAIEEGDSVHFDAPAKVTAMALYALSELGGTPELDDGIVAYLVDQNPDLILKPDPEEILWTILALKSYVAHSDSSSTNFITQVKVNGELVMDQSVTGKGADEVYESQVAAGTLSADGVNDFLVKKEGTGPLYFGAQLISYLDPTQATRVEDGMVLVRELYELTDDGKKIPATTFRKGKHYLSELRLIVPKDYSLVALTDPIPAGMKVISGRLKQNEPFTQNHLTDGQITYYAPFLPAGVYSIETELQAVLGGTYLHLPAVIQTLFESAIMSRTEGAAVQIID